MEKLNHYKFLLSLFCLRIQSIIINPLLPVFYSDIIDFYPGKNGYVKIVQGGPFGSAGGRIPEEKKGSVRPRPPPPPTLALNPLVIQGISVRVKLRKIIITAKNQMVSFLFSLLSGFIVEPYKSCA